MDAGPTRDSRSSETPVRKRPGGATGGLPGGPRQNGNPAPSRPKRTPEEKAARRARRRRRRLLFTSFVLGCLVAAAALGGWVYWTQFGPGAPSSDGSPDTSGGVGNLTPPSPVVIVPAGSQYPLAPGQHNETPFVLNGSSRIMGDFSSTSPATLMIMTAAQYATFAGGGSASSVWTSGATLGTHINTQAGAGSYELVFLNPGGSKPAFVQVVGSITYTALT